MARGGKSGQAIAKKLIDQRLRDVLAANLNALMERDYPGESLRFKSIKVADKTRGGATKNTITRIAEATDGTSIDKLAVIARVFEVEPYQLLTPNLDVLNLPKRQKAHSVKTKRTQTVYA